MDGVEGKFWFKGLKEASNLCWLSRKEVDKECVPSGCWRV
jgi:hypothetical protein